ncbi:MAG: epoxyqueuosine reductase [Deltaproteobacteria bacterium]|nr:epoxyqueuosine reductase [Deltaproteobacteria bacterium]
MLSTNEIKMKLRGMGADLVGIVSAESTILKEHGESPEILLPGAKSLISIGVSLNRTAVCSGNLALNRYDTMCVYERLNHISLDIVRLLSQQGAKAISVPPYLPVDMGAETKGMKGEINHKTAGAAAGLGSIGLNRLLITPQFGPFIRLGTIITDMLLNADDPLKKNPCDQCGLCAEACPAKAIQEDGTLDYGACVLHVLQGGLPGIIGVASQFIGADEEKIKSTIYDSNFWDIWQSTVSGIFYNCSECIAACPVGAD